MSAETISPITRERVVVAVRRAQRGHGLADTFTEDDRQMIVCSCGWHGGLWALHRSGAIADAAIEAMLG